MLLAIVRARPTQLWAPVPAGLALALVAVVAWPAASCLQVGRCFGVEDLSFRLTGLPLVDQLR